MENLEYANAYSEVNEILKSISKEDYEKIPKSKIELFKKCSNPNYKFNYNPNLTLEKQNVSKRARAIIAILFSAALAPIAGRYKIIPGVIAGMLHVAIVPLCAVFQGGIDLYNNGFAAGFAACIIIAIIEAFKEEE